MSGFKLFRIRTNQIQRRNDLLHVAYAAQILYIVRGLFMEQRHGTVV
jgi:hypothetical protein